MYTEFYGLREKPFSLSPDPRFLFLSDSHREALAHLLYGIEQGEGFIAITGEVGTGKTTLCRTLLQRIEPGSEVAFLFNPQLSGLELLQAIDAEFGLETAGKTRRELMDQLNRFLLTKRQEGRRVVLLIDEAQNLEREALEQVRLLSNLETDTTKLIQIILLGQPELDAQLESPELRQLRQRINVRWRLGPLSQAETRDYVRHRLRVAAGSTREIFSELALREIHRSSGGIPRLINRICDRALLAGFAANSAEIGLGTVAEVQREIDGREAAPATVPAAALGERLRRYGLDPRVALGALAVIAISVGVVWWKAAAPTAAPERAAAPAVAPKRAAAPAVAPELAAAPLPAVTASLPVPAAAPAPVENVPPPAPPPAPVVAEPPAPVDFGSVLAHSAPAATVAASLDVLLRSWGDEPVGADLLLLPQFGELLENIGFAVLELEGASLELMAAIDRPALLVLSAPDGAPRGLLLTALAGDEVTLEGVGPIPLHIPRDELAQHWSGRALVPWKDHAMLPPLLGPGATGDSVRWLQDGLAALGLLAGPANGEFGDATQQAVRAFQREEALPVDGWVGPLTLIRLYARLPGYAASPRLASAALDPAARTDGGRS
jgi:general secretion pathway protein A